MECEIVVARDAPEARVAPPPPHRAARAETSAVIDRLCEIAALILRSTEATQASKFAVRTVMREAIKKSTPGFRHNQGRRNCEYITEDALRQFADPRSRLVEEHLIPLRLLMTQIYGGTKIPDAPELRQLAQKYATKALITKAEDDRLRSAGLVARMPEGWDERDMFARYKRCEIELKLNPYFNGRPTSEGSARG